MGQPVSKEAKESRDSRARSDAIDKQIADDSKRYKKECKILLLGSGESGKSTIVKQMKIIHQRGFDERERAEYRTTIYKNVLDSAGTLARVVRRVGVDKFGAGVNGGVSVNGGGGGEKFGGTEKYGISPLDSSYSQADGRRPSHASESFGPDRRPSHVSESLSPHQHPQATAQDLRAYAELVLLAFPARGIVGVHGEDDLDSFSFSTDETSGGGVGGIERGAVEVGVDPVPFTRADEREREAYAGDRVGYEAPTRYDASAKFEARYDSGGGLGGRYDMTMSSGGRARYESYDEAAGTRYEPTSGRGIQTGRVSARPNTAEASPGAADASVLAQTHAVLTPALADAIWHVARAPAVERMVDEHPAEFYLMDSAGYFFSQIHRIAAPTYMPSEEDVLRARAKSTAIIETRFWMGDLSIHMFDVGGQRSERKKWIHCFESVTSIIFCTALSEYDQVLEEERRVNRMRESLYLFESVINSRWFLRTSVILFLNKIDVFKRKLPKIPLGRFFPEYAGGNDLQKAAKYILWKFMQENRAKLTVYPHVTQATNTKNVRLVFAAVKETILQNALKDSGIL